MKRGRASAQRYEGIFGKKVLLELQDCASQNEDGKSGLQAEQDTGIELVATNDIHYTFAEDEKAHDILLCIQTGKKVADEDRMRRGAGITVNPRRRCRPFSHTPEKPLKIHIKLQSAVMWRLNSASQAAKV